MISCLALNICAQTKDKAMILPISLGTDNKRPTIYNKRNLCNFSTVDKVTGEVSLVRFIKRDGRGFVVIKKQVVRINTKNSKGVCMMDNSGLFVKGAKHFIISKRNVRSYLTKSGNKESTTVQLCGEIPKDLERRAKH